MNKHPRIELIDGSESTLRLSIEEIVDSKEYAYRVTQRGQGNLEDKALYLPNNYQWQIVTDNQGVFCLIALRKKD